MNTVCDRADLPDQQSCWVAGAKTSPSPVSRPPQAQAAYVGTGGDLGCTANDVRIAELVTPTTPVACQANDVITVPLRGARERGWAGQT